MNVVAVRVPDAHTSLRGRREMSNVNEGAAFFKLHRFFQRKCQTAPTWGDLFNKNVNNIFCR
ncbi:hypothetical protein TcasGA2_TC011894 [Tribolium castaneum]|uniref:Uncharacterized protein n=1 Tax=Tribolium castaneum TaxID=7070 RepID=D6WZ59_TRICA|nr:hypothetical protein TcasGA2_TC011894 [Tribolium castaneum]